MMQLLTIMSTFFLAVLETTNLSHCKNYTVENMLVACCQARAFILLDDGIVGTLAKEESWCPKMEETSSPIVAIVVSMCIVTLLLLAVTGVTIYYRARIIAVVRNYWARLYTNVEETPLERITLQELIARLRAGRYTDQPEDESVMGPVGETLRRNLVGDTLRSVVSIPSNDVGGMGSATESAEH